MELDTRLTSIFARLYRDLSKEDVQFMNYLLRVNLDHRWPKLKKVNAGTLLIKMKELELLKVDICHGECCLSCLTYLLGEIGRQDLASAVQDFGWLFYPTASTIPLSDTIPYKLDKSLTSVFARLYRELSKEDVRFMNYLLRVNFDHRWPKLKKVNADTLLLKMMELEIWKVDIYRGECRLWCLIRLLDEIGRRDLASAVQDFGWSYF